MSKTDSAPPLPPNERLGFLIYRAGVAVSQAHERRMRPLGLTPIEVGLLTYLASHGADHVRAVGRTLGVSPQTIVNVSRSLEERGLVRRATSTTDQRAVLIEVTEDGRAVTEEADQVARSLDARIARVVGSRTAELAAALQRVLAALA